MVEAIASEPITELAGTDDSRETSMRVFELAVALAALLVAIVLGFVR